MNCDLSMDASASRFRHDLREKEEKHNQQRRKHLLYIIGAYLKNQRYTKSFATLMAEAQLCSTVQVCDNIDLEIILKDYEEYYNVRFNKYPALCRRVGPVVAANSTSQLRAAETSQNESKINSRIDPGKDKNKEDVNDLSLAFTTKPIFNGCHFESATPASLPTISQSIEELYGLDSEMRKIAEIISKEIIVKDLNVKWSDVKGLSDCKTAIKEAIVYPIKYPEYFEGCFSPWSGILLYGPPGTGKTMLARATATECNCTFFNVSASSLVSKWRGDSEKYVRVLFDLAYKRAPTVIFIDEIDWIATISQDNVLSEPARRFRAELLANLDGLLSNEFANVVLLAATNTPGNIDAALLRRLEKHISVPLPDEESRLQMLKTYVEPLNNAELSSINSTLNGYSGSDIKRLCKQARMYQVTPVIKQIEALKTGDKSKVVGVANKISSIQYIRDASEVIKPANETISNKLNSTWNRRIYPK